MRFQLDYTMVYINRQRGTISCVAHEELDHILSWMELHVPTLSDIHSKRENFSQLPTVSGGVDAPARGG